MRRLIAFPCAGEKLLGSLDEGTGTTGLLIVSGGNELRTGAHRGMALLAARLAAGGTPTFRYDRRGIGDSTGENGGFTNSRDDLAAAAAAFRAHAPHVTRVVGFGNCDAATALALFGSAARIDRLILANPWVVEPTDDLPPTAAIRARYAQKLCQPREWLRLMRGGVDLGKLVKGLSRAAQIQSHSTELATNLADGLRGWGDRATILLAAGDATAIAYRDAMARAGVEPATFTRDTASHSFARAEDSAWLQERIVATLTQG